MTDSPKRRPRRAKAESPGTGEVSARRGEAFAGPESLPAAKTPAANASPTPAPTDAAPAPVTVNPVPAPAPAPVPTDEIPIAIEDPRAAAAAAVEELEVNVRNSGAPSATSDLAADALRLIRQNIGRMQTQAVEPLLKLVRENLNSDYLDPDFWKGVGMVVQYQVDEARGFLERRVKGQVETDPYGLDLELVGVARPFASFLYQSYFRVSAEGLAHVPEGRVMLAANRAGLLPLDGAMIATALLEERPDAPLTRVLHERWMRHAPGLGAALAAVGQVAASPENARALLEQGQPICVFPEGEAGAAKLFRERYRLAPFADSYVAAALRAGAPVVPVAVIGSEEAYPNLANIAPLAQALRLPFFPATPFFPLLGPLGALPLPAKWTIVFHAPLDTAGLGADAADDPAAVARLTDTLRATIQATLTERTAKRKSVLLG